MSANPIRVLIVEDELLIAADITRILKKFGYTSIGTAIDYTEALHLIEKKTPDIIIIDIMLSGSKDGIELAEEINNRFQIPFIFSTSHADKVTVDRAKATRPNGYLVKPFEENDLYTSIEIALANYNKRAPTEVATDSKLANTVFIKADQYYVKVSESEILWIKSDHNYLEVKTLTKTYLVKSSFDAFLAKLTLHSFFRVHRSYMVNLKFIRAINSNHLIVEDYEIPIGRRYRDELLKYFNTTA